MGNKEILVHKKVSATKDLYKPVPKFPEFSSRISENKGT
jgi:hypothetical protein